MSILTVDVLLYIFCSRYPYYLSSFYRKLLKTKRLFFYVSSAQCVAIDKHNVQCLVIFVQENTFT